MSLVEYQFSISGSTATGSVDCSLLDRECFDSGLSALEGSHTKNDVLTIVFSGSLSGPDLTALSGVVNAHNPTGFSFSENFYEEEIVKRKVVRETWYAAEINNEFKFKFRENTFKWKKNVLLEEKYEEFDLNGNTIETITYIWETKGNLRRRRKKE